VDVPVCSSGHLEGNRPNYKNIFQALSIYRKTSATISVVNTPLAAKPGKTFDAVSLHDFRLSQSLSDLFLESEMVSRAIRSTSNDEHPEAERTIGRIDKAYLL